LVFLAALASVAAPRSVHATDIVICNSSDIAFSIAAATRQGDGLFSPRSWYVEGWFPVEPDDCANFPDHTDQPIFLAFSFTDDYGDWGAAEFSIGEESSSWRRVESTLCVADVPFGYSLGNDNPDGPCEYGYFHFPAALYLEPSEYTSRYTLRLHLDDDSPALAPEAHVAGVHPPPADSTPYQGGKSLGDKLWDQFWHGLNDAAAREAARGDDGATSGQDSGAAPLERATDNDASAPAEGQTPLGPPRPFEPGTLTAKLLGAPIVRRTGGNGEWFDEHGNRVDAVYQLDGLTSDDLLDPPTQRQDGDADVAAAQGTLSASVASFPANRGVLVTNDGRLYYSYASDVGIRHDAVDLVVLDLANADAPSDDGPPRLVISCRKFDPCVIAWGEDDAGRPSGVELYSGLRMFASNERERDSMLGALRELQRLYPAEPLVTER